MIEQDAFQTVFLVLLTVETLIALPVGAWAVIRARRGGVPHKPPARGLTLVRAVQRNLNAWAKKPGSFSRWGGGRTWIGRSMVAGMALCAAMSLAHWPQPRVHDEFAYLMQAETFLRGRLANPAPAPDLAGHLQSEHVLVSPTYAAKYPPAQALLLAAGWSAFGSPAFSLWLGCGMFAAAGCWCARSVLPPRWALLAGLLCAAHPGVLAWWGNSYWGGLPAAIGGALLAGACIRIARTPTPPHDLARVRESVKPANADATHAKAEPSSPSEQRVAMVSVAGAIGLAILANSRPLEGLVFAAVLGGATLLAIARSGRARMRVLLRCWPGVVVLSAAAWGTLEYNRAVTGSAWTMPQALHRDQYNATPLFFFQSPQAAPAYADRELADFYAGWEKNKHNRHRGAQKLASRSAEKALMLWGFFVAPGLTLCAAAPWLARRERAGAATQRRGANVPATSRARALLTLLLASLATAAVSLLLIWFNPHYFAPMTACAVVVCVAGACRGWRASAARVAVIGGISARIAASLAAFAIAGVVLSQESWADRRRAIERELRTLPGPDLVIVRHGPEYRPHEGWVANGAEPLTQAVVWMRELDSRSIDRLVRTLPDRGAWLLHGYRAKSDIWADRVTPWAQPFGVAAGAPAFAPARGGVSDLRAEPRAGARGATLFAFQRDATGAPAQSWIARVEVRAGERSRAILLESASARDSGASAQSRSSAQGDLNGDGIPDTVTVVPDTHSIEVRLSGGSIGGSGVGAAGAWATAETQNSTRVIVLPAGVSPGAVVLADLDGDGDADIAIATRHAHGLVLYENLRREDESSRRIAADTPFSSPAEVTLGEETWFVDKASDLIAADLDGDGRDDLAVACADGLRVFFSAWPDEPGSRLGIRGEDER